MSGSSDAALLDTYRWWISFGSNMVLASLAAEILVMFAFRHSEALEKGLTALCTLGIIVGIGIENVAGGRADDVVDKMRQESARRIAGLNKKVARSRERAAQFERDSLELKRQIQPRTIGAQQMKVSQEEGRACCHKQKGRVIFDPQDFEAMWLANQIQSALTRAWWSDWTPIRGRSGGFDGVLVQSTRDTDSVRARDLIVRELQAAGLTGVMNGLMDLPPGQEPRVDVYVNRRPLFLPGFIPGVSP